MSGESSVVVDTLAMLTSHPLVGQGVYIVVALTVLGVLVRISRSWIGRRVSDSDVRYRANKTVGFVGYAIALIVVLTTFAGSFSGLSIAIGAASAGIAFALQEVIASFAGWLAVSFSTFYKIGDRVQLGGIRGDVIDIGFLRTTIMECGSWVDGDLYNGRIVRVANSYVFKEPVFNYSGDFPFLWDEIVIPVKYGSDYAEARKIMQNAAHAVTAEYTESARLRWQTLVRTYRIEDAGLDPLITLVANDNWAQMTLRYIVDYRARRITKDALFTRILHDIESSEGRVAMASATFHLVEWPKLEVSMPAQGRSGVP